VLIGGIIEQLVLHHRPADIPDYVIHVQAGLHDPTSNSSIAISQNWAGTGYLWPPDILRRTVNRVGTRPGEGVEDHARCISELRRIAI
jgi:hypothetical protein